MKKIIAVIAILSFILSAKGIADMGKNLQKATFAGGCFWGIEKIFAELDGVVETRVGYTGGNVQDPSYEQVCSGRTNHAEAIEVTYDPSKIKYEALLEFFFSHHDPTTLNRQGNDIGTQYRSAIFYHDEKQEAAAHRAVDLLTKAKIFKNPIKTEISHATEFYPAEEYHQKYLEKNPNGYCHIQYQSSKISQVLKS